MTPEPAGSGGIDPHPPRTTEYPSDPLRFPDVASRVLRGSVLAASDEFFAEKENLIKPGRATFEAESLPLHNVYRIEIAEVWRRKSEATGQGGADHGR